MIFEDVSLEEKEQILKIFKKLPKIMPIVFKEDN